MSNPYRNRTPQPPPSQNEPDLDVVEGYMQSAEQALVPSDYYQDPPRPQRKVKRRRQRGLPVPRFTIFVIAVSLIVSGVFFTLLNVDAVPEDMREWWPVVSLAAAVMWSLGAIIRRDATSFVAGATIAGVSVSFLLATQGVATVSETVVGIILITLGLSVVIRGLFIRPRVVNASS